MAELSVCGGRSERQRLKSGDGKTVSDLTRMLVMVSSRVRCGLNWYLKFKLVFSRIESERMDVVEVVIR